MTTNFDARRFKSKLIALDGPRCNLCDATDRFLAADHVIPRSAGGSNDISNLQLVCEPCNYKKADLTPEALRNAGLDAFAKRITETLARRATLTSNELETRMMNSTREEYVHEVSYKPYTVYTQQHAFGIALTGRMIDRGLSEEQLRKQVARITGNCFGKNIGRWRRTQYPAPPFFRALSIVLEWPLKSMCQHVDFSRYRFAPRCEALYPLMPYLLQQAMHTKDVVAHVKEHAPQAVFPVERYFKTGVLSPVAASAICNIVPTLTPERLHAICSVVPQVIAFTKKKYLTSLNFPPEKYRRVAFNSFLRHRLASGGWFIKELPAFLITPYHNVSIIRHLGTDARYPLPLEVLSCLCMLLDISVLDIPQALMPETWYQAKEFIASEVSVYQKTLFKHYAERREVSYYAIDRALGLKEGSVNGYLHKCIGIPTHHFQKLRSVFGMVPPARSAFQKQYLARETAKWRENYEHVSI